MTGRIELAVVIIGRNEGKRLTACLDSIGAADLPAQTELIYVDSNSTDGSPERAEEYGARVIVLESGKLSAARARNAGWRSTNATFVLFLDGDTILHRDFVSLALKEFSNPQVAVVWGHRREIHPEASLYNRILDLDWIYRPGPVEFCGGDALMRRSCLERANGFNPELIAGEEPEMCRRMRAAGDQILHIDAPMTGHDIAMFHFSQYWRRAIRTGHAYAQIAEMFRESIDPFWSREARSNLIRGTAYILLAIVFAVASIATASLFPLCIGMTAFGVLAVRTAFRSRWKGISWTTLVLFGIHSHIQQIPVLAGQVVYLLGKWRKQNSELIEYKKGPQ